METFSYDDIAGMIDHSLLAPTLTERELESGIDLALTTRVASVCILPYFLGRCAQRLDGSTVRATTTIGFPHGGQSTAIKLAEVAWALEQGAAELDCVVNLSRVLSGNWQAVTDELRAVIESAHTAQRQVKVIFENCYLQYHHKVRLCQICGDLNADWVKTSTGYGSGGATIADLELMRQHSPPHVQVKAAGGIRDLDALLAARRAGVTRVGASRTAEILAECCRRLAIPFPGRDEELDRSDSRDSGTNQY
jgi:deoxyribose-phosphate aldolase